MGSACVTQQQPLIEQRLYLPPLPRKKKFVQNDDDSFTNIESTKLTENRADKSDEPEVAAQPIVDSETRPEKAQVVETKKIEDSLKKEEPRAAAAPLAEAAVQVSQNTVSATPSNPAPRRSPVMADHGEVQPLEVLDFENE